jgi:putative transposase
VGTAVSISISERQRAILERWSKNKAGTSAQLVERCSIILLSADGVSNVEQGRVLGVDRQRARRWRTRWAENQERLADAEREGASDKDLAKLVGALLAVACELPEECGRPVTHWTPRELVDEVIKRGIVESISPRHVDRLLKGGISARTKRSTG